MITNKEIIAKHSRRMKNACIDLTNTMVGYYAILTKYIEVIPDEDEA